LQLCKVIPKRVNTWLEILDREWGAHSTQETASMPFKVQTIIVGTT
jgi:hypothetical protein